MYPPTENRSVVAFGLLVQSIVWNHAQELISAKYIPKQGKNLGLNCKKSLSLRSRLTWCNKTEFEQF